MKRSITCVVSILLVLPMLFSCQDHSDVHSVVEKAIAAHGGKENLSKPRKGILKGKGVKDNMISEEAFDLPKQWKRMTASIIDKRVSYMILRDGKVWEWEQGDRRPREKEDKGEVGPYIGIVTTLLELLEKGTKLSGLGESKVLDRPAIGLRTERNELRRDYFFDKRSGLMVQVNFKWRPEPGKEFATRTEFREYKEVDGLQVPCRQTTYIKIDDSRDYVLLSDYLVTEIKILEGLPKNTFEIPGPVGDKKWGQ